MAFLYLEKLKWDAFSKAYGKEKYSNITSLNNIALELLNKSEANCKRYFEKCKNDIKILQQDFVSSQKNVLKNQKFAGTGMV